MVNEKERLSWMDNLRALAIFSVIFLHVSVPLLNNIDKSTGVSRSWWVGNIYNSSVRFCVPVFLMLTGALLLSSDVSLGTFLKRRFTRVVFPFIFWSLMYLVYQHDRWVNKNPLEAIKYICHRVNDGVEFHMWYVFMILGIYLFVPILTKWIKNSTEREILYFLFLWLFVAIRKFPSLHVVNIHIDLSYFSGFIGYLVLGYYLSIKQFKTRHIVKIAASLFIVGYIVTILGTYNNSIQIGKTDDTFYEYLSINVIVCAIGIFLFFKNYMSNHKIGIVAKFLNALSRHSYGIYLLHILVLTFLLYCKIDCWFINAVVGTPATAILGLMDICGVFL